MSIHDCSELVVQGLNDFRNAEGALFGGDAIGFVTSLTGRPTGSISITDYRGDGGYKPFGIYRGIIIDSDGQGRTSNQVIHSTFKQINFDKTHNNIPIWYLLTQNSSGESLLIDDMQVSENTYAQVIIYSLPLEGNFQTEIKNSNFHIRHFEPSGDFYINNGDGKVMPATITDLTVTNSTITIHAVPLPDTVRSGYDRFGLPIGEIARLRGMGFTVNLVN